VKTAVITKTVIASIGLLALFAPGRASAQIVPQPWVSVGGLDGDITYSAGAKSLGVGLEVGTGKNGATGVDVLQFLPFPGVSPYVGVGLYSGDTTVAVSGGLHLNTGDRFFVGAGYHTVRGFNGQIGIKLLP
jgi:hypothetical protein